MTQDRLTRVARLGRRRLRLQPPQHRRHPRVGQRHRGGRQGGRRRRGAAPRDDAQARRHHARSRDAADGRLHVPAHPDVAAADAGHRGLELQPEGERLQGARARRGRLRGQARSAGRRPTRIELKEQILSKMQMVRNLRAAAARRASAGELARRASRNERPAAPPRARPAVSPRNVVVIGSSTGRADRAPRHLRQDARARSDRRCSSRSTCPTSSRGRSPSGSIARGAMRVDRGAGQDRLGQHRRHLPGPPVHGARAVPGTTESRVRISAPQPRRSLRPERQPPLPQRRRAPWGRARSASSLRAWATTAWKGPGPFAMPAGWSSPRARRPRSSTACPARSCAPGSPPSPSPCRQIADYLASLR